MISLLMIAMMVAPALSSELKILDDPGGSTRPAPCALTCSGISRWDEADKTGKYEWKYSGEYEGKVYKIVEMSDCKFVSPPVITATTGGKELCPSISLRHIWESQFYVYSVEDTTHDRMKTNKCYVHWSAFGYNC